MRHAAVIVVVAAMLARPVLSTSPSPTPHPTLTFSPTTAVCHSATVEEKALCEEAGGRCYSTKNGCAAVGGKLNALLCGGLAACGCCTSQPTPTPVPAPTPLPTFPVTPTPTITSALDRWLASLSFTLPELDFVLSGFSVSITGLTCGGMYLGGIDSAFAPPASLSLGLDDVTLTCAGDWAYANTNWPYVPSGSGDLTARVASAGLGLTLTLSRDGGAADGAAEAAVSDCSPDAGDIELDFHGGLTGWLLEALSGVLAKAIAAALDNLACDGITTLVEQNVTALLREADAALGACTAADSAGDKARAEAVGSAAAAAGGSMDLREVRHRTVASRITDLVASRRASPPHGPRASRPRLASSTRSCPRSSAHARPRPRPRLRRSRRRPTAAGRRRRRSSRWSRSSRRARPSRPMRATAAAAAASST